MTPSKTPNSESIPNSTSIIKNRVAQKGEISINVNTSLKVTNARPGP